jgi:hypothetical protein
VCHAFLDRFTRKANPTEELLEPGGGNHLKNAHRLIARVAERMPLIAGFENKISRFAD